MFGSFKHRNKDLERGPLFQSELGMSTDGLVAVGSGTVSGQGEHTHEKFNHSEDARSPLPTNNLLDIKCTSEHRSNRNQNMGELVSIERKELSSSILSELNAQGLSPKRSKRGQSYNRKLKLSNIRSVDEDCEESPIV